MTVRRWFQSYAELLAVTITAVWFLAAAAAASGGRTSSTDGSESNGQSTDSITQHRFGVGGAGWRPQRAWINPRVEALADAIKKGLDEWRQQGLNEDEIEQAVRWSLHTRRPRSLKLAVYANKPHPNLELLKATSPVEVNILYLFAEWKGTFDKLNAFINYVNVADDDDLLIFVDAFDVFGNGFDGHELLRRFFLFDRPVVISTEENIFPREVGNAGDIAVDALAGAGLLNGSHPSRYLNAGGIMGYGWALKLVYADISENMIARKPWLLQDYADSVGNWFFHAYDQYELWRFFIRHVEHVIIHDKELLVGLDVEQSIFGSTVLRQDYWPDLLAGAMPWSARANSSIDIDAPLIFDAPQSCFEIRGCHARFVGRKQPPIFWHGHGPWKPAWEGLRDRMREMGCFVESKS
eukprot:TRINITY_DN52099_c0_g1_i1.p1 TRINITY_DN52099_c0_g1~~TRINITY_DN52099_c0_g1_i1.p1  ORF type:complete len:409 (+),score=60.62 TRINITY_DN52099_c0_g1_i1:161-1387(+)